ncbi:MAG: NADH-dependent flavin oxidoreductase [Sporolactobacillus sp.]
MTDYPPLFEPIVLTNGVILRDRLAIAPMTTWSGNDNGSISDQELAYYQRRSDIAGLFISACMAVSPTGLAFDHQFIGYSAAVMPRLKRLAAAMKSSGSKAVLQIQHGGSEVEKNLPLYGQPVSASAVPAFSNPNIVPRALTEEEIEDIITEFAEATRVAVRAGFDGVEIHGANHYLIQQFVSAHFNRRQDSWGGTLENRLRFPFAVFDAVQAAARAAGGAHFIVGYRFSPEEIHRDCGYTLSDTMRLVDGLLARGVDYLHVSQQMIRALPAGAPAGAPTIVQRLADHIAGRVPLIAVGGIHRPNEATAALQDGADIVAIGREAIIDPDWTKKVREGRASEIQTVVFPGTREQLVVPERLWQIVMNRTGWFPVSK